MTTKQNPTIQDIAKQAGVGVGTVSRVLNDSPKVSPETRSQVQGVIAELGYRPKSAAKILRTRKTHEIGFITDEIASTPFAVDTIRGAQDTAWQHGKILVLVNANRNSAIVDAAIETMLDRQVEGVIYAAMYHQPVHLPANIYQIPTVLLDCFVEDGSLPSVVPDEFQGGYDATVFLLEKGHRRIGFINNRDDVPASKGRLAGFQAALRDFHVSYQPQLVCIATSDPQDGYKAAWQLLGTTERPTALFCFNDRVAMGVYDAARDLKLAIPHDLAIVGFDNHEIIAAHLRPPLTTMQLPHYAMGQWAVNYLVNPCLEPANGKPPQIKLPCPLVVRESV